MKINKKISKNFELKKMNINKLNKKENRKIKIREVKSRIGKIKINKLNKKIGSGEKEIKKVNINIVILSLILVIIFLPEISALGITPARTTINFEPNLHKEISFSVINSEHKEMAIVIFVRGDLNNSITLHEAYAEFSSSEESKSFTYEIDLPAKIDKPGNHEVEIVVMEMPKKYKEKGAFVGATIAVVTQLYVYVPYPGKYAEFEFNIIESNIGETTRFIAPVINRGKLDIVRASAIIDIYGMLNEKIATVETDEKSIKTEERVELFAEWKANVNPGTYRAFVTLKYDGETKNLEKNFNIGEMLVEIEDINVKDFELGGIAKLNILVNNKWGQDLKDVYIQMIVYNEENEIMADFKSANYDVKALEKKQLVTYWDTAGVKKGNYNGKIILKYGDKKQERDIIVKVSDTNIEVVGFTGKVIVRGKGKLNIQNILIILVGILIVINIIWFVIIRNMRKRKEKRKETREGVEVVRKK